MVKSLLTKDIKTTLKKLINQLNSVIEEAERKKKQMEDDTDSLDREQTDVADLILGIQEVLGK